jgi:hypothetical protein
VLYSIATAKSTHVTIPTFIQGVNRDFELVEELLKLFVHYERKNRR